MATSYGSLDNTDTAIELKEVSEAPAQDNVTKTVKRNLWLRRLLALYQVPEYSQD